MLILPHCVHNTEVLTASSWNQQTQTVFSIKLSSWGNSKEAVKGSMTFLKPFCASLGEQTHNSLQHYFN